MSAYTATTVPTQFFEANGIRFAYRRWGKRGGLPLVFNQHFTGNLDNWDPAVLDRLSKEREVIIFNNAGVASSGREGETAATFGATYNPPENLWLKVFFTDSEKSQAAGRAFLKRYLSRTENRDSPINDKVTPAQIAAVGEWGSQPGKRFAYLKNIKQPTLVVSGNHDVIVYTVNSLYLVQNMPNAKLILYPDANHGSWYEYHEDFVFETNRFLNQSDRIATVTTSAAAD